MFWKKHNSSMSLRGKKKKKVQAFLSGVASGVETLAFVEISSASSNFATICSIEGRCCFSTVHERANWRTSSKACDEYSPPSLGSAKSAMLPHLVKALAWHESNTLRVDRKSKILNNSMQHMMIFCNLCLTILFNGIGFCIFMLMTFLPEMICRSTTPKLYTSPDDLTRWLLW